MIEDLIRFIGHEDVTRYTKAKIREWRDAKLETLSPNTVSQVYLASIRTILKWAKENELIVENVAEDVRQSIPKKVSTHERGYTDEEARAVLAAARAYEAVAKDGNPVREAATMTAAKQWLPWLAAFSGARIGEIAQVRREDFRQERGVWIMRSRRMPAL